jgi:glycosyltransferase involved in cell wall biosynthesis
VVNGFRILHCLRAPVGGLFRHVRDLSTEQGALGHDVGLIIDSTVADPLTESRLEAAGRSLSLGIVRIPMGRLPALGDFAASRAVRDVARKLNINVLHGHGAKGGAYARLAGRLLRGDRQRAAAIYTPHGGSLHYPPNSPQGLIYTGMEKLLARWTDGLIFESDFARRTYEARVGRGIAPTRVITNALQPHDFSKHAPVGDAADFLFVGELRRLKGVDILLRALAEVRNARPVRAVIVGDGPDRQEFERLATELRLGDIVDFVGAMPAAEAFAQGRCIVVPSRAESLPFIVLEAAAAELPIIATNAGGIPEIVHGSDVRLLPPDDVGALVRAMHEFLDAPDAARARARSLRQIVAQRFAIKTTTAAILDFYAEVLGVANLNRKPYV